MDRSPELERLLVDEMRDLHGCHTVLLYGSRAAGTARPHSDYDVLGLRDEGPAIGDTRAWNGSWLDAWIYPVSALEPLERGFLRLRGAIVLQERDGLGHSLLERVERLFQAGPPPLAPDALQLRHSWARKMLERIQHAGPDDIEVNYRRLWLLHDLLENWFELRGRWYLGPKNSFAWLKAHDPQAFTLFDRALRPGASLETVTRLVEEVLGVDDPARKR